ncbi:signal peptidase I [Streptomyces boluensis]|uniref:Signal peptidase I n=1 Tax=Streptomyces boluensis TaxID=1775135 RepID=A0A964UPX6_9ACTN|nr:signal peptidase I [Streptomyces boluensis]NBE53111.1 signal peptidase I [Streptomyces boluensis]
MDTEAAQHTERDRSPEPADTEREGEGSRSAAVSGPGTAPADEEPDARPTPDAVPAPEADAELAFVRPELSPSARRWRRAGVVTALCLVFLLLVSTFVMQPFLIPSRSMEPTLNTGDRVLVNKLAYRFGSEPQRGDVVVFDGSGYFGDSDYIKRVVGVGGDRVACCGEQGKLEVNGEPVDEAYLYPGDDPSTVPFDVVVPEGSLFVLGDHRSDSADSRDHLGSPGGGMVPVDSVIGRADFIGLPLDRSGSLDAPDTFAKVPRPGGAHG